MIKYTKPFTAALAMTALFAATPVLAQDGWAGEASLTGSRTTGNTETTDLGLGLRLNKDGTTWSHEFRGSADFGRVSGETIFTVLRMQEVEVDDNDRPTDPPVVTSCDVLLPPFDDIVPRTTPAEKREKAAAAEQAKKLADIKKRKQQGVALCPVHTMALLETEKVGSG